MKRTCSLVFLCCAFACTRTRSRVDLETQRNAPPRLESKISDETSNRLENLLKEYEDEHSAGAVRRGDPLKPWNVVWFHFNDKVHFWLMKPISKVYGVLLFPKPARRGIRNLIINLGFPGRFFNTALQGHVIHSGSELVRFLTNSTIGIVGLWDPATHWLHMKRHDEDFDQTLGVWGLGTGVYITWPIVGPSSVRGTLGALGESILNPIATYSVVRFVKYVNDLSLDLNEYETLVDMAVDPYSAIRDAYFQNREEVITR